MTLFLSLLLAAAPVADSGSVSSANASYDGNALVLKGQVVLDHGLGKMQADEAVLERQEAGKDFPFSLIHLQKSVLLSLQNHAQAQCDTADLDFVALKGALSSVERVVYTDQLKRKKGDATPVRLLGKFVDLAFEKTGQENQKTTYGIEKVTATSDVQIEIGKDLTLLAGQAIYQKNPKTGAEFDPHITALPDTPEKRCRLIRGDDVIESSSCQIDLLRSKIALSHPQGITHSLLGSGTIRFASETLLWDQPKNTIFLRGHVQLQEPALGTVDSAEEIQLIHGKNQQLAALKTKGKTTIRYLNSHTLVSFGPILVDRAKMQATAQSPAASEGQQVSYEEGEITAFGDKAQVDYTLEENTFQPVSIALKGNVRLYAHDPQKPTRCGIADRVTYSPQTRTFILNADPGKKVLFVNEEENLRIAAQEVHVTEDPTTKKQVVKGIGHVQLAFTSQEEEMMQKLFKQLPQ